MITLVLVLRHSLENSFIDQVNQMSICHTHFPALGHGLDQVKRILFDATLSNIVESNMLHSFGHLVQHCATSSNNVGCCCNRLAGSLRMFALS